MPRATAAAATLGALLAAAPAARAQGVVVRTDPPRATLVCDGAVVGITPLRFDPARARACAVFARDREVLVFNPAELTGAIASFHLTPTAPRPSPAPAPAPAVAAAPPRPALTGDTPCNRLDPRTGLLRVCFPGPERAATPRAPRRRAAVAPRAARCGHVDPGTGLITICFDAGPRSPHPPPPAEVRRSRCGRVDPDTGLLIPCFN